VSQVVFVVLTVPLIGSPTNMYAFILKCYRYLLLNDNVALKARNVETSVVNSVCICSDHRVARICLWLWNWRKGEAVFFKNHLDIGWNRVSFQESDSHGLLSSVMYTVGTVVFVCNMSTV